MVVLLADGPVSYNLYDGTSYMLCDLELRPGIVVVASIALDYEGHNAYQLLLSLSFVFGNNITW